MDFIMNNMWVIVGVIAVVAMLVNYRFFLSILGVQIVPDDSIGLITKKFVLFGKNASLPDGRIIALNGEAGFQADTLAPGIHFWLWPWQYTIDMIKFVSIPQGMVGVVEACDGNPLPSGRIIAKQVSCDMFQDARAFLSNGGERGPQMTVIPPGTYRINSLLFTVKMTQALSVPQGQVGVVEALDGKALPNGRIIADKVNCDSYQDAEAFFANGGERGPQMGLIPPGTYRLNPALFRVELAPVVDIPDNKVGIVTTREGKPLPSGVIAGGVIEGHEMFQNPSAFVAGGGYKGLQEQVLLAGRYFINPRFATVEIEDMTDVPIAHVGVVVAFVGKEGKDLSGEEFRHGNLVSQGEKGVWMVPLDPGKYPINRYTHRVINVPTANVVLNWATGKTESHHLDANLSTITVRSADGFKFNLDVSQIIHIPRNDAPKVVARFGDMSALVTQVLEPTIGNYFRNAAQNSDIIEFLKNRTARQNEAREKISNALKEYNVGAVDTLIGDIVPPEELMRTLTDRKIAEQERVTFETQMQAQVVRKELEQATAIADTQSRVVDAERKVQIAEFEANANVKTAKGSAESKTINAEADAKVKTVNAEADANVLKMVGEAEAGKTRAVGTAEADVIKQKIDSMNPEHYATIQVAQALASAGVKLVPDIVAGGDGAGNSSLVNVLLGNLLSKEMNKGSAQVGKAAQAAGGKNSVQASQQS